MYCDEQYHGNDCVSIYKNKNLLKHTTLPCHFLLWVALHTHTKHLNSYRYKHHSGNSYILTPPYHHFPILGDPLRPVLPRNKVLKSILPSLSGGQCPCGAEPAEGGIGWCHSAARIHPCSRNQVQSQWTRDHQVFTAGGGGTQVTRDTGRKGMEEMIR